MASAHSIQNYHTLGFLVCFSNKWTFFEGVKKTLIKVDAKGKSFFVYKKFKVVWDLLVTSQKLQSNI